MSERARHLHVVRTLPPVIDANVSTDPQPLSIGRLSAKQVLRTLADHLPAAIADLEAEEENLLVKLGRVRSELLIARLVNEARQ